MKRQDGRNIAPIRLPEASYDPMKTIEMEGEFLRGLAMKKSGRSPVMRIVGILFALIFFILPALSLFVLILSIWLGFIGDEFNPDDLIPQIFFLFLASVYFLIGVKIFRSLFYKKSPKSSSKTRRQYS